MDNVLFDDLFHRYYPKVFRLCKGYFKGDEGPASDAAQETFIKVWQHLDTFRNDATIGTWIYRIAVNTCLTQIRKIQNKKEMSDDHLPHTPNESGDSDKEARFSKMYACIGLLPPADRMIILMILEAVPYDEIAKIVGITEGNLRVKIHRIKNKLTNCVHYERI